MFSDAGRGPTVATSSTAVKRRVRSKPPAQPARRFARSSTRPPVDCTLPHREAGSQPGLADEQPVQLSDPDQAGAGRLVGGGRVEWGSGEAQQPLLTLADDALQGRRDAEVDVTFGVQVLDEAGVKLGQLAVKGVDVTGCGVRCTLPARASRSRCETRGDTVASPGERSPSRCSPLMPLTSRSPDEPFTRTYHPHVLDRIAPRGGVDRRRPAATDQKHLLDEGSGWWPVRPRGRPW